MKIITNIIRDQAFATATDKQKEQYTSAETEQNLWVIAQQHGLTDSIKFTTFSTLVGDIILGLRKQTELTNLLVDEIGLDENRAKQLALAVTKLVSNDTPTSAPDQRPPQETGDKKQPPRHIRTMAEDMKQHQTPDEVVYTSTQEAILTEGRQAAERKTPVAIPVPPPIISKAVPPPVPTPRATPKPVPPAIPKPRKQPEEPARWG
jgi:hypothetical protein